MSDILVLVVIALLPAAFVVGPLAVLTLGLAGVADLDGNGLIRRAERVPSASARARFADEAEAR